MLNIKKSTIAGFLSFITLSMYSSLASSAPKTADTSKFEKRSATMRILFDLKGTYGVPSMKSLDLKCDKSGEKIHVGEKPLDTYTSFDVPVQNSMLTSGPYFCEGSFTVALVFRVRQDSGSNAKYEKATLTVTGSDLKDDGTFHIDARSLSWRNAG